MEMRAFIMSGREEQLVLPLLRLHGLRGERKVDFVDSRTRLGSVAVPGTGAGAECAGFWGCTDGETVRRKKESCK